MYLYFYLSTTVYYMNKSFDRVYIGFAHSHCTVFCDLANSLANLKRIQ